MQIYKRVGQLTITLLLCFSLTALAGSPKRGVAWMALTGSYGQGNPDSLHGYRASYELQMNRFVWGQLGMYFDFSVAHFKVSYYQHKQITTYSIAPMFRVTIIKHQIVNPYIELGIGLAGLSSTHIANRDLGANWSFQDVFGGGLLWGHNMHLDTSIRFLHYSNAGLASSNAGIDVTFLFTVGYRFNFSAT